MDALTTHQLQVERRERHRANQVYVLTTQQLQVERRERKSQSSVCAHHTPATGGEERVIVPIKCMRPHTSYRGESHSANQVDALTHTSYRWRGERDIEPIKCMCSPHSSYRWRGERDKEPIKCMRSPHTSYRWRGESHSANQVFALTTHQLQVERRET